MSSSYCMEKKSSDYSSKKTIHDDYGRPVEEGDVEVCIYTDKRQYKPGEPVTLTIAICNMTNDLLRIRYLNPIDEYFGITVRYPEMKEKVTERNKEDNQGRKQSSLVQKTKKGMFYGVTLYSNSDDSLPPYGKLVFSISLSQRYDLSYPPGTYTVNLRFHLMQLNLMPFPYDKGIKDVVVTQNCQFEILFGRDLSISEIMVEEMANMFGYNQTVNMLCMEAENILGGMKDKEVKISENTSEGQRLMKILRSIDHIMRLEPDAGINTLMLHGKTTVGDINNIVQGYRRKIQIHNRRIP